MSDKLSPTFPYKIEKAPWYLLFLWREGILTDEEFELALIRLKEKTNNDVVEIYPMMPRGYTAVERSELRRFEKELLKG